ncbi:MAG: hypothetical protein PHY59_08015 [Methanobacterium sp.]|nr:hypothetical protein [Methanobacterium sp.]
MTPWRSHELTSTFVVVKIFLVVDGFAKPLYLKLLKTIISLPLLKSPLDLI